MLLANLIRDGNPDQAIELAKHAMDLLEHAPNASRTTGTRTAAWPGRRSCTCERARQASRIPPTWHNGCSSGSALTNGAFSTTS
jgi:hypothetical protein